MAYTKTVVCLANSVKTGGYCIAGKELIGSGPGSWIRPVSCRPNGEVSLSESLYVNGGVPRLRDIMQLSFERAQPHAHQIENNVIDDQRWQKIGEWPYEHLAALVDVKPSLWGAGEHTFGGLNDCISAASAAEFDHSLLLIKPPNLSIRVGVEGYMYQKRVARAFFTYGGTEYGIKVTDPIADAAFRQKADGEYMLDAYICVSLTEPYERDQRCHKLAAAIISHETL